MWSCGPITGHLVPDLGQQDDDEDNGESPGRQEPDDGELALDGGVVPDHSEHVEPLYRHPQHGEEAGHDGHHKQAVEKLEVVAARLCSIQCYVSIAY